MKKKLLIIFPIIVLILLITSIFICISLKNDNNHITFETSQTNIIDSDSLNIIENIESEIVNDITNETVVEIANVDTPVSDPITSQSTNSSNEKITTQSTTTIKTSTKEETKSNTNVVTNTNTNKSNNNQTINTPSTPKEEKPTTSTETAKPELAYSTYRVTNNDIVPEVIKILNDEISKDSELVAFGSKAIKGNKKDAYAKTSGFTYLWVKDIEKGKVSGNYTTFTQRVKNVVGGFGNYNVYAEDEFTYNGQGLNPKWSQTLVWIYLTF
ncbi:MAG: hypothetical protein HFJ42_01105 [Clostridia bacterium]|nr:hypothetical protein [Clostridia bacterium]